MSNISSKTFVAATAALFSLTVLCLYVEPAEAACGCQSCLVVTCEETNEPAFDNVSLADMVTHQGDASSILFHTFNAMGITPYVHIMSIHDGIGSRIDHSDFHLNGYQQSSYPTVCSTPLVPSSLDGVWPGYVPDWPVEASGHFRVSDVIEPRVGGQGGDGCVCEGCEGWLLYRLSNYAHDPNYQGGQCATLMRDQCDNPVTPDTIGPGQFQAGYSAMVASIVGACEQQLELSWIASLACGGTSVTEMCHKAAYQVVNEMAFGEGGWSSNHIGDIPSLLGTKAITMPWSYAKRPPKATAVPTSSGTTCLPNGCQFFEEEPAECSNGWQVCHVDPGCDSPQVDRTLYLDSDDDGYGSVNVGQHCDLAECDPYEVGVHQWCSDQYCSTQACRDSMMYMCSNTWDNGYHCRYRNYALSGGDCDDDNVNIPYTEKWTNNNCHDGIDNDCDGKADAQDPDCADPCGRGGCPNFHQE